MPNRLLVLVCAVLSLVSASAGALDKREGDEIRRTVVRQADAWNAHDAHAYAALFSKDCDVVNVLGWWWKGRDELASKLAIAFTQAFRDSTLTFTDVHVRPLSRDIALAHARWTMTGAKMPPGMPEPREGIQTLTLVKQSGKWLISGFQNTLSMPERAFPAGTSAAPAQPKP